MKKTIDQTLVLSAIRSVREELKDDTVDGAKVELLMRLATLYSLLNVDILIDACNVSINERKAA
jgi:hypothetical protein